MKKILLILTLFISFYANSQTVLTAGDIAFVGSNTDGVTNADDNISFVLLKDIDAATTIIFTDMGWNDTTGFFAVVGDGQFTWTSGIARTAGQVVTLDMMLLMPAAYSMIGDQLFAIQGTIASPIFIAGIQHNDTPTSDDANWDGAATTNSTSALPNALVTGDTAVRLIPEQDNWQFSCALAGGSPVTGTPAQIRAIVNNRGNWNGNNDTVYNPALPAGCTFTITTGGDTTPPVIVCAPTPAPLTAGINGLAAIPDLVTGTTATDDVSSPANITITQSPTAGTMVGVGVNTVTLTATDEAGNSASCTIDVTVNEPPFTSLAPGDIAFVGFNLDGNDSFAFIILKDIIAGTNIKLTDCGVTNPNSITCIGAGGEGSATWYAPSAMSAGDIVTLPGSFINGAVLSISGDQLFAYQGTAANPNFITGIHANMEPTTTDADWDGANTNNATTALPDQLTNGVNAIRVYAAGPPQTEIDNWQFDCTLVPGGFPITGTAVELAAIINDIQYWVSNDAVEYTPAAKPGCIYTVLPPDTTPPTAICQDITVQLDGTGSVTIVATDVDGGSTDNVGIVSYAIDIDTFDCGNVGTPVSVTLTVTDAAGLFATCSAIVTVEDNIAPTAICQAYTAQLDATGNVTITAANVDGGSTDACGIQSLSVSPSTFTCAEIGSNTVTLTVTDVNGNVSTCTSTVTVEDNFAPNAICKDTTVYLDETGNATITAADINDGSTDNCGIATVSVSPSSFTCAEIGPNTVTLTVTDVNGNVSTCTSTVTVTDNTGPVLNCTDFTVALDVNGEFTIDYNIALAHISPVTDNCAVDYSAVIFGGGSQTFTCSDVGTNTRILGIRDESGNDTLCTVTITVTDPLGTCNQPPIAVCQPVTVTADGSCQGNAAAIDFDGGSTDPDGDPLIFTINPIGPYPIGVTNVTLTVSDGTLTDSCTTTITVIDNTPPIANCVAPFTIQLDASGNASITAADINNGSTDNCGIANTAIDIDTFDCSNIGANTVTLTVTDIGGNTSTCTTTVTVEDSVAPTAVCQNITVQLDANGDATIFPAAIDGGSSDNCGIASLQFTDQVTAFAEVNEGQILTISLPVGRVVTSVDFASYGTPNGSNGNYTIGACHAATSQAIVESYALGNNSFSVPADNLLFGDPCNGTVKRLFVTVSSALENNSLTFGCADVGINDVTLLVTDTNGNTATCTATVTVEDNIAPTAVCQNITVQLDANGNATITAEDVDNGSSDACGLTSTSIDVSTFDCSNVGTNNVILTVIDTNGNVSSCTAVVTVEDNIVPVANCAAPFTIQLDANGNASITVADIENGSTDNCGIATTTIDIDTFDCSNVGDNTVTLTVTDVNGNVSTCTTIVTVEDNVAPIANCVAPFTIQLDANGTASITAADIDNGSTDACGIASATIDITDFDCSNVGDNTVTLTVTDVNGNVSTCTTIITVEDNLAPTIVCPTNISANTDAGNCFATVNYPMPIAFDNCGIDTVVQTAGLPSGSQFPVGVSTIEFTAT
ncbi:HYR domain-containing protein, partial [Aequorivita sp. SDUM287046]